MHRTRYPNNSNPNNSKVETCHLHNNKHLSVTIKQNRSSEDICTIANIGNNIRFYAVYDGHGRDMNDIEHANSNDKHVALYLKNYLHQYIADALVGVDINDTEKVKRIIVDVFKDIDQHMYDKGCRFGSTGCIVIVTPEHVLQVNLGDSRSVIFDSQADIVSETKDHEPKNEEIRIRNAGGYVSDDNRVNDTLATSRAFGDFELKMIKSKYSPEGPVSSIPDIIVTDRCPGLTFVLGTDGLYDGCGMRDMRKILKENSLRDSSAKLIEKAKENRQNDDDATCIVGYV